MVQSVQRQRDGATRTIVGLVVGIAVVAFAVDESLSDRHLRDDLAIVNESLAFDGDVELLQEAIRSLFRFGDRHLCRSRLRATASIIGHPYSHRDLASRFHRASCIFRDPPKL